MCFTAINSQNLYIAIAPFCKIRAKQKSEEPNIVTLATTEAQKGH